MAKDGFVKSYCQPYPGLGCDIFFHENHYMTLGTLVPELPIIRDNVRFGEFELIAGESRVVQLGTNEGASYRTFFSLINQDECLLYLGYLQGERAPLLVFKFLKNGRPRDYERDLFGHIKGSGGYYDLLVCFNLLRHSDGEDELHITTRSIAARVLKSYVRFADES